VELHIDREADGRFEILALKGELDIATQKDLRAAVDEALASGRVDLVVDLNETTFIDSTALGVLIASRRKAEASHGSFTILCDQPRVLRVFEITRTDQVFHLLPDRAAWKASGPDAG
jgi:anti-sigma B factor antagonist